MPLRDGDEGPSSKNKDRVMSHTNNRRRNDRIHYGGVVLISWEDVRGNVKYGRVKCHDIAEGGLRIESPEPIPMRTRVVLRGERLLIDGSATVRHIVRIGGKYLVGLEMIHQLDKQALPAASAEPK